MDVSLISAFNTSLSGLGVATAQVETHASNLANLNTPGYRARKADVVDIAGLGGAEVSRYAIDSSTPDPDGSNVDIAHEAVGLIQAKTQYTANAKVIAVANSMLGTLLDVVDSGRDDKKLR